MVINLFLLNIGLWVLAALTPGIPYAVILLAWTLGLRHALDVDHIAAIDAVSRQMMSRGRPAHRVGLYFSIGHSAVVLTATCIAAWYASSHFLQEGPPLVGNRFSALFSALFLLLIGGANLVSLFRPAQPMQTRKGSGRLMSRVTSPGHMVVVGFLFGLGFDTASEIGLMALTAAQRASVFAVVLIPVIFAAGMMLIDGVDSFLMVKLWSRPTQRVTYRRLVTLVSAAIALFIGGQELLAWGAFKHPVIANLTGWIDAHVTQMGGSIVAAYILLYFLMRRRLAIGGKMRMGSHL
ncbi:hypothetical protein N5W20_00675 [Candidatus Kirkpatrickella diaphorinae]|uniref:Nickel/cobalt efflux system n=1 Tax=Candidatus Kirkpatrickella diaphorinae TaxID=2984322 RepID=A0ABY6GIT6_9PROT|nr:hypothetical protein [Candidatus Kirkpatrickella diaphorinae]UYH51431.1 hypothetical protein N5W20_00675 [Candidatus Kirkpatrickella diaphorinae]